MTSTRPLRYVLLAGCLLAFLLALNSTSFASCGDSLTAITNAIPVRTYTQSALQAPASQEQSAALGAHLDTSSSIVGMWHVMFVAGGQTIQEAYQIWNEGGTEVHNPNIDPRTSAICLGVWDTKGTTYKLEHRVWVYDTTGDFQGTYHLREMVWLTNSGSNHRGTFVIDFYDPNNKFQWEVTGNVVAERITPETN